MKFIPGEREVISDSGEKVMESTYSGHIECRSERFDLDFKVPVWDVRDGEVARAEINKIGTLNGGSRFFKNSPENMMTKGERRELNQWRGF